MRSQVLYRATPDFFALYLKLHMTGAQLPCGIISMIGLNPWTCSLEIFKHQPFLQKQLVFSDCSEMGDDPAKPKSPLDAFLKLLRDLIPDNIAAAATDMNILGIIFFSVFFGVALSLLGHEEGCGQIIRGIEAFNQVIIKMARTALDTMLIAYY